MQVRTISWRWPGCPLFKSEYRLLNAPALASSDSVASGPERLQPLLRPWLIAVYDQSMCRVRSVCYTYSIRHTARVTCRSRRNATQSESEPNGKQDRTIRMGESSGVAPDTAAGYIKGWRPQNWGRYIKSRVSQYVECSIRRGTGFDVASKQYKCVL